MRTAKIADDKVTVLAESYRFYCIKLPFSFYKVTVFDPKIPFSAGPKLPFILGQSYRYFGIKLPFMKVTVLR